MIWSDEIAAEARAIHAAVRRTLRAAGLPGELEWTGGSSVPGTLTTGDVDLHLRVPADRFADAVAALRNLYPVGSPDSWAATLAVFAVPDQPLPTGLAVTPIGSEHDLRFTRAWSRLAADPGLRARYNELKRHPEYETAKSAFFDELA